jgi:type IV pilus assembly protein PilA
MHDALQRVRENRHTDKGFTLIELLVVVVIIGVLVAIAVPVYLNYRQGAADKAAQSDLRGAVSAIEQFYTDNANNYPADIASTTGTNGKVTLPAIGTGTAGVITLSDGTSIQLDNVSAAAGYIACTTNANGSANRVYVYNSGSTAGSGSVKQSTQTAIGACITNGN